MTLPLALVCLGAFAFAGFVLWLRDKRAGKAKWTDIAPVANRVSTLEGSVTKLEEWKSNVNLASGLRRKPEDRA